MNLEQFWFEGHVGQVVCELQIAQELTLGLLGCTRCITGTDECLCCFRHVDFHRTSSTGATAGAMGGGMVTGGGRGRSMVACAQQQQQRKSEE